MTEQNQARDLVATLQDALHQLEGTHERPRDGVDAIYVQGSFVSPLSQEDALRHYYDRVRDPLYYDYGLVFTRDWATGWCSRVLGMPLALACGIPVPRSFCKPVSPSIWSKNAWDTPGSR